MRRDYRLLKPGEPVLDGDEVMFVSRGNFVPEWGKINPAVKYYPGLVRRPATGPASAGQMIEVMEAEIAFLRELLAQKESV